MKDLILALARRGKTIVMTSHLLADVEDVCDRVAIMYNGRLQAIGSIDELLEEKARHRVTLPDHLTPDQLRSVLSTLRERFGTEPEVDHPRRDLEQFFLDVVEKARKQAPEASGVDRGKGVATYLAGSADAQLQNLVAAPTSVASPPPTDAPAAQPAPVDLKKVDDVLSRLVDGGPKP